MNVAITNCLNCGKPITEGDFCSRECATRPEDRTTPLQSRLKEIGEIITEWSTDKTDYGTVEKFDVCFRLGYMMGAVSYLRDIAVEQAKELAARDVGDDPDFMEMISDAFGGMNDNLTAEDGCAYIWREFVKPLRHTVSEQAKEIDDLKAHNASLYSSIGEKESIIINLTRFIPVGERVPEVGSNVLTEHFDGKDKFHQVQAYYPKGFVYEDFLTGWREI